MSVCTLHRNVASGFQHSCSFDYQFFVCPNGSFVAWRARSLGSSVRLSGDLPRRGTLYSSVILIIILPVDDTMPRLLEYEV